MSGQDSVRSLQSEGSSEGARVRRPARISGVDDPEEHMVTAHGGRNPVSVKRPAPLVGDPAVEAPTILDESRVELRTEELEEIISYVPNLLIRWGITGIFLTLVTLLAMSWLVRYPELVGGEITVTTQTPPIRLVAKSTGEIERLLVRDGANVSSGDLLVVLKSTADYREIFKLEKELEIFESPIASAERPILDAFDDRRLGAVQDEFSDLLGRLSDYRVFIESNYYLKRLEELERQIEMHYRHRSALEAQQRLLEEELRLAERQRQRQLELAKLGLLSDTDKEKAELDHLQKRQMVEAGRTELANSAVRLAEYRSTQLEIRHQHDEEKRRLALSLGGALNELKAQIRVWEQQCLLRAPVSGTVSFLRALDESLFVAAGDPLMAVIPLGDDARVHMLLSQSGAGRVKVGQKAILRFDSYPVDQYGTVLGRVESISLLPSDQVDANESMYRVAISLPQGLVTGYGRELELRQEMRGSAEIVTEDLRLLERLFNRLRYVATARSQG